MWNRTVFFVLIAVLGSSVARAEIKEAPITKEEARQAIAAFCENPTSEKGANARSVIIRFAEDSPDVAITMRPKVLPWTKGSKVPEDVGANLLVAFAAGQIRAQLDQGKANDDPVAGAEQVIATYRQLQKAQPSLKIPEVDHLIDLQNEGKLAEYVKAP